MEKQKDQFPPGNFIVVVTKVLFGFSEIKHTPFIAMIFESQQYCHLERFYLTGKANSYLGKFLSCFKLNVKGNAFDINEIIGQKINIVFNWKVNYKNGTKYKNISIIKYSKIVEIDYFVTNDYDETDVDDVNTLSEIFGTSINEIAESMRIDPSEVTSVDIREYHGY